MNLKKNDKIILITGIVILIVSAIGIALYTSPSASEEGIGEMEPALKTFSYTWKQNTQEIAPLGDILTVDKKTPFEDSFQILLPSGNVITSVDINLKWEDDVTYGLLFKKGLDTLTAKISHNGEEKPVASSTGSGNHWFNFTINNQPSDGTVSGVNRDDAKDTIANLVSGQNSASFDVTVSIETGERIWRLFKYLKDKGNDFELTVKYTYYTYELNEQTQGNSTNDETNNEETPATGENINNDGHGIGEFYKNLGYGRGMI